MLNLEVILMRRIAIASFVLDTFFQALGLLGDAESSKSSPSAIYVAYAPHPYTPIAFFSAGVILQVHWFLRFHPPIAYSEQEADSQSSSLELTIVGAETSGNRVLFDEEAQENGEEIQSPSEGQSDGLLAYGQKLDEYTTLEPAQPAYLPLYILSTLQQASWAAMWMTRHYSYCGVALLLNFATEVYSLFYILGGSKNHRFPHSNIYTHLVVKIRIAFSLLYLWKTWGAVDILPPPSLSEGSLTCIFFVSLALASGPDPTLGIFLVLILAGFATGQHTNLGWNLMFGWTSVVVTVFTALDWMIGVHSRRIILSWPQEKINERAVEYRVPGLG